MMFDRIRRLVVPPVFDDEDKTRHARLVHFTLLSMLITTMAVFVLMLVMFGSPHTWVDMFTPGSAALVAGLTLVLLFFVHRGQLLTTSSLLVLVVLWLILSYWICMQSGISDSTVATLALVVVLAGVLLGGWGAISFMLLSVASVVLAFYLEMAGIVDLAPSDTSAFTLALGMTVLVLTGLLLRYALQGMNSTLARARRNARAQAEANRELQAVRATLEQRVTERTQALEQRLDQLQAAAEIGRTATGIHNLDSLLAQVAHLVGERFGCYYVGIFLLDESGERAVLRAASSAGGEQMLARGYSVGLEEETVVGDAVRTGKPCIALGADMEPIAAVRLLLPHSRSEIALPLVAAGRVLGALDMQSAEEAAFGQEDVPVMQILADLVAVAVENANLFARSEQALVATRRAYGEVSREGWTQMVRARRVLGYRCDPQGTVRPTTGLRYQEMQDALHEGHTLRDSANTVTVPIRLRDQFLGAVRLRKAEDAGEWTDDEVALAETLADQISVALESARLYQDTQNRAAREQLLGQVAARVRESLDVEAVLRAAAQEIRQAMGLPEVVVRLVPQLASDGAKGGASAD